MRQVTIAIFDGVGEDVRDTARCACIAGVAVRAIGIERQLAIGAFHHAAHCAGLLQVSTCSALGNAHHTTAGRLTVGTEYVVGQHTKTGRHGNRRVHACAHRACVAVGLGHVVHNGDNNFARTGHTARARHTHSNGVSQCVIAITAGMRLSCSKRVLVADGAILVASIRDKARDFDRSVRRIYGGQ